MTPEQFRAILDRHGGVIGHRIVDPTVDTTETDRLTGEARTTKGPNPVPRVKYVTRDGEITARQKDDGSFEILEDPKGLVRASVVADGGTTPTQAEARRHNQATEAAASNTAARQDRRDQRQLTIDEIRAMNDAKKAELDARVKNREMDAAQAKVAYDQWWDREVRIPAERHRQEIENARRALDEDKAKLDREKYQQEQVTAREKEATRQREAGLDFAYKAGQDAVANQRALLPYMVGPTFGAEFADALNAAGSGGPVHFSPDAVTFRMPDLNATADREVARALALYNTPVGAPAGAAAAGPDYDQIARDAAARAHALYSVPVAGGPTQGAPATVTSQALAGLPVAPPLPPPVTSMPGAASAVGAGGVGGSPTQEEIARRLAAGYGT